MEFHMEHALADTLLYRLFLMTDLNQQVSEYDQEIPQSHTADQL